MKYLKHILLLAILLGFATNNQCFAQFSPEEQHQIDSLNAVIKDTDNQDTTIALSYLN